MTSRFSRNLGLVLKLLSISSAKLASELEIDKSVVSRWLRGSVSPSAHNLSRLSAFVATRVEGFNALDWEREAESMAELFGADLDALPGIRPPAAAPGLPVAVWDQLIIGAASRGNAYEGFFRSTRPHPAQPEQFLHEFSMVRRDAIGLLRLAMGSADTRVDGWMLPLNGLVYSVASDPNTGSMMFGIFNGVGASRVDILDGLVLIPAFDKGRSPLATPILSERVGDLSGDVEADNARFEELASHSPLAADGAVPVHIQAHLVRDIGPTQLALGGDWLLNMSLARSMTRGRQFDPQDTT